jgi:hypothetical protein
MGPGGWVTNIRILCVPVNARSLTESARVRPPRWILEIDEDYLAHFNPLLHKGKATVVRKEAATFNRRTYNLQTAIAYVNGALSSELSEDTAPIIAKKTSKTVRLLVARDGQKNNT